MPLAPFQVQPRLTQIAMAVKPEMMIADMVCPRVPVMAESFIYSKLQHADLFTIPDTKVGRTSFPNTVEFGAVDVPESTQDHGLDDFVPQKDLDTARDHQANFDPLAVATEGLTILIELAREKRVADLYFTLATYASTLRTTLSGTSQWSDYTNSDPYTAIVAALDAMLVRPNIAVFGRSVWSKLRTHPKIVAAALARGGVGASLASAGVLGKEAVADLLELDMIEVGESFFNSAKLGQTPTFARLWGKHAAFLRIDRNVRAARGMSMPTFAMTAQYGTRIAATIQEPKRGLKGGQTVRVGEQIKEFVTFQEGGFFFQDAVA